MSLLFVDEFIVFSCHIYTILDNFLPTPMFDGLVSESLQCLQFEI